MGNLCWIFETRGPIYGTPAVDDGVVYFGCNDGTLYAVEAERSTDAVRQFMVGEQIFHLHFGDGTIIRGGEVDGDQELVVDFQRHGRETILANSAPLDPILG